MMNLVKIQLNYSLGYSWYQSENIYVKGYLFDGYDNLHQGKELVDYFFGVKTEEEFYNKLKEGNGIFSVIILYDDKVFFAADKTRTFPLFYSIHNKKIFISDDADYLKKELGLFIREESVDEFISTGFVTGKFTLINELYQTQAGEYIIYSNDNVSLKFYHTYLVSEEELSYKSRDILAKDLLDIFYRIADRVIKFAKGRQIVIPLSGGFDSRLLVSLLKDKGYSNVVCFTYGKYDSFEVKISKKVAQQLGYQWYFIEYDSVTIGQDYAKLNKFIDFANYSSKYTSILHIQDYFAIKTLEEQGVLSSDSILLPGHSGDFLGGSHVRKFCALKEKELFSFILKRHYILSTPKKSNFIKIKNYIDSLKYFKFIPYSIDENFNMKERQAKFIINSVRTYEFFGFEYLIPLWDNELVEFFRVLPLEYKVQICLYNDVMTDAIFSKHNVSYIYSKSNGLKKIIRKLIKLFLPDFVLNLYKKKRYEDINNFLLISKPLLKEIDEDIHCSNINYVVVKWYLSKIR